MSKRSSPMPPAPKYVVNFPTLGMLIGDWIEAHCVVPDGFDRGTPFLLSDWQLWNVVNHYQVRPTAQVGQMATAFHFRRSLTVRPQKALALDTPIATPSGWTTMGAIMPGDWVFDERGEPCKVLSKSQVWMSDTYRVTFSDGASLVACGDHQWQVERRTPSATYVPDRVTTSDMYGDLVDKHGARKWRIRNAEPLRLPEADLLIDPYVLGAWLGDGNSDDGRMTGLDREVFDRIRDAGYEVRQMKVAKRVNVIGLKPQLRTLGLFKNKHIPASYLRASEKQRWALLQGLMDTDGFADVRQGKCEFTTVLPALRDGMRELLYSLGIKHTVYEGVARLNGRATGPKWRVNFAARADMPVFHLARKRDRLKPPGRTHAQYEHRRVIAIEKIETVPTQCITVDAPSHMFLAGREMIPTCNTGKGPFTAAVVCTEAVGPALFAGWAEGGEVYDCADHGCGCGWREYTYAPGEPMGMPWPTPLIQLTATSEEQVGNVFDALRPMIEYGPLSELIPKTGEEFIRLPGGGRIDVVTASAQSRLGQRVTFCAQDETGIWTATNKMIRVAETQRRGLAGMGGRAWETTNAWDPSEDSVAQRTFEAKATDIFRDFPQAPSHLSYKNKAERRKIHRVVYDGSPWVDLDAIEAEAAELIERDPAQAERFFGNRIVYGAGHFIDGDAWDGRARPREVPDGATIVLGMDGSDVDDWTGIRAETSDGHQFTPTFGPDRLPTVWDPAAYGGQVPRLEVAAAFDELMTRYNVVRAYIDPPGWTSEIDAWAEKYGDKVVIRWATYRPVQMHAACERLLVDVGKADSPFTHDGCQMTAIHVRNTRKAPRPGQRYVLAKASQTQKIDLTVCSVLAHEAHGDALAAGLFTIEKPAENLIYTASSTRRR